MSEINHLGLSKPVIVSGSPSTNALYTNAGQPWASVADFLQACNDTVVKLSLNTTILVIQNGVATEMWNPTTANTFVVKTQIPQLADVATSGSYEDLKNKPTIPVVNDSEIVFTHDGKEVGRMTTNQSVGKTVEVGGEKNPLEGKKWTVLGDSLTAATSYTTKPYHAYVAEQLGVDVVNLGVGGTGYWKGYEELNNFALKVGDIPEGTDFVTVFGSFNDIASLDLEEYEANIGNVGSVGYTTICGAINEFFDELYARFPACKVGVILPTPWKTMTPIYTDAPAWDYVEKLRTICERKGVPVLDLFKGSGLRPWDSANRLAMYSKDLESGQTDPRGTHPNEAGHAVIASKVREFIKTLI